MKRQRIHQGQARHSTVEAMELLVRMRVRGSFRLPVEGRGTSPTLTDSDVAGVAGMTRDDLAIALCEAVVCRAERDEIALLAALANDRVLRALGKMRHCPLDVHARAD